MVTNETIKLNEVFFEDLSEEVKDKIMSVVYYETLNFINELRLRDPLLEVKQPITCNNNYNLYMCYSIVGTEKINCLRDFDCIQRRTVTLEDDNMTLDLNIVLSQLDENILIEVETHIPSRDY